MSHDREFLNNVVGSSIVFENGTIKEYVGGYDDWLRQRTPAQDDAQPSVNKTNKKKKQNVPKADAPRKLKFAEKKELEALPGRIEELETQIAEIHSTMADPSYYQQPAEVLSKKKAELDGFESELAAAYERWEELESLSS